MPHVMHIPAIPKGVVLDLDGTLVDSLPDITAAANHALVEVGIVIDAKQARQFIGNGSRQFIRRALLTCGQNASDDQIDRLVETFEAHYRDRPCHNSILYPGVRQVLAHWHENGAALGICTNKPQLVAEKVASKLGLDVWIGALVGAGRYALKPDPAPLLACLSRLGLRANETWYVGDMSVDLETGRAAGTKVLLMSSGYSSEPVDELGADDVMSNWLAWANAINSNQSPVDGH